MKPEWVLLVVCACASDEAGRGRAVGSADAGVVSTVGVDGGDAAGSSNSSAIDRFALGEQRQAGAVTFYYPQSNKGPFDSPLLGARFTETVEADPCSTRVEGDCAVRTCPVVNGVRVAAPFVSGDVGRIDLAGGNDMYKDSLERRDSTGYVWGKAGSISRGVFLGGESVELRFGADPLATVTTTFPLVLLLTEPAAPPSGDALVRLPADADIDLAFERGGSDVELWVSSMRFSEDASGVFCRFPTDSGRARIPKAITASLPRGREIQLTTVRVIQRVISGYSTTIAIQGQVFTPDPKRLVRLSAAE